MKTIIGLAVAVFLGWLSVVWYSNRLTDDFLNLQVEQGIELLDAEQGFFGGKSRFRIARTTDIPIIDELLKHAVFEATYSNIPTLFRSSGEYLVLSSWRARLDQESLSDESCQLLEKYLGDKNIQIDFSFGLQDQGYLSVQIPAISLYEFGEKIGEIAPARLSGRLNAFSLEGDFELETGAISIRHPEGNLQVPTVRLDVAVEDYLASIPEGEMLLNIADVQFSSPKLSEDVSFDLMVNAEQQHTDDQLSGNIDLQVTDAASPAEMIQDIALNLRYAGLDQRLYSEELFSPRDVVGHLLASLREGLSVIDLSMLVKGQSGQAELDMHARYLASDGKPENAIVANLGFKGDRLYIDQTPLALTLFHFIESGFVETLNNNYRLALEINNGTLAVNGNELPLRSAPLLIDKILSGANREDIYTRNPGLPVSY